MALARRKMMAMRAAGELKSGDIVNLGIGIPTLVAEYVSPGLHVLFHGENGLLGIGPAPSMEESDPNISNAGGLPCTMVKGASYFDSAMSFAIIRSGLIDVAILGALEVAQNGDLANWIVPGRIVPGMGGGMELAQKSRRVIALTTHVDKSGGPKIRKACTLPITAPRCVDMIITDLAVMKVTEAGLLLTDIFSHTTVDDVLSKTEAQVIPAEEIRVINYQDSITNEG